MIMHMGVVVQIRRAMCMMRRKVLVVPELVVRCERRDRPIEQMRVQASRALLRGGRRGGYVDFDLEGLGAGVRAVAGGRGGGGIVRT